DYHRRGPPGEARNAAPRRRATPGLSPTQGALSPVVGASAGSPQRRTGAPPLVSSSCPSLGTGGSSARGAAASAGTPPLIICSSFLQSIPLASIAATSSGGRCSRAGFAAGAALCPAFGRCCSLAA